MAVPVSLVPDVNPSGLSHAVLIHVPIFQIKELRLRERRASLSPTAGERPAETCSWLCPANAAVSATLHKGLLIPQPLLTSKERGDGGA